ncbi:uncharacterized protein N7498_010765 [Penicillium cinerascens]|uniref:Cytochrome P450 n=1 Tax=Penicillium cinerascens TaxID=70096 RepID=A0A9W9J7H6_9EURO|nr:uncharacterized protein N7498_010765 [Penicillium cinerascens]KAJ5191780.1 hypothetical protein N7498_010765 [Penicillium cinerascens]
MQKVVPEIWPIFDQRVREMVEISQPGKPVELQHHVQAIMAEATICIFFGQGYANSKNVKSVLDLAEDIAELLGIYQNQSFLGRNLFWLWKPLTWAQIVLFRIPLHIGFTFARTLWTDISDMAKSPRKKDDSLVNYLVRAYASPDGHLSVRTRMWIMVLILTFLFASLHQTATIMVWITYHLALHPDCQNSLRDEASSIVSSRELSYSSSIVDVQTMQNAVKTDSFIREVLRMKGDLVNLVRAPIRDIELGGYIVPKGSLVFPVTHLSYRSPEFVNQPNEFSGARWVGSGKSAAMTGPGYLAFGLGRWACPGRLLAVMELKCWIFALLKYSKVDLDGGKYEILDPFNITSVPPRGDILIERWESHV